MDPGFCVDALQEALSRFGKPEIFNTNQDAQFTADAFTDLLIMHDVKISMDGKGRFIDKICGDPSVAGAGARVSIFS